MANMITPLGLALLLGACAPAVVLSQAVPQVSNPGTGSTVTSAQPTTLTGSTDKQSYHPGEPVYLLITLTNVSAQSLIFRDQLGDWNYVFDVRRKPNTSGMADLLPISVKWTGYGERLLGHSPAFGPVKLQSNYTWGRFANERRVRVARGTSYPSRILLSRLYDLSESGTYFVRVGIGALFLNGKDDESYGQSYTFNVK